MRKHLTNVANVPGWYYTTVPPVAAQIPSIVNAPGTKGYMYADGAAALERGEEIDYDGP